MLYASGSQSLVHGLLGMSGILSRSLKDQNSFHNNTKMLFGFFTVVTFVNTGAKQE